MKFEQNGLGFQNLYNITQGMEVPWLTYQQFSNLIGNVTDMLVVEQKWQPVIDAIWENRTVEDYETTSTPLRLTSCGSGITTVPASRSLWMK